MKGENIMKKSKSKEYYENKFNELVNSGKPIIDNTTHEIFEASENEEFRQCYEDTPERKTFPKYWFVSNMGNLISVCENKLVLLHKNQRGNSDKCCYKYMIRNENGNSTLKNIEVHNLVGLVFGAECYGLAAQKLQDDGVYSFGVRTKDGTNVQGHHKDGEHANNDPGNIKFLTSRVHSLFDSVPKPEATAKKHFEFMKKFGEIAEEECPNGFTILLSEETLNRETGEWISGKRQDIESTKQVVVTENFLREMNVIMNLIYEKMAKEKAENE